MAGEEQQRRPAYKIVAGKQKLKLLYILFEGGKQQQLQPRHEIAGRPQQLQLLYKLLVGGKRQQQPAYKIAGELQQLQLLYKINSGQQQQLQPLYEIPGGPQQLQLLYRINSGQQQQLQPLYEIPGELQQLQLLYKINSGNQQRQPAYKIAGGEQQRRLAYKIAGGNQQQLTYRIRRRLIRPRPTHIQPLESIQPRQKQLVYEVNKQYELIDGLGKIEIELRYEYLSLLARPTRALTYGEEYLDKLIHKKLLYDDENLMVLIVVLLRIVMFGIIINLKLIEKKLIQEELIDDMDNELIRDELIHDDENLIDEIINDVDDEGDRKKAALEELKAALKEEILEEATSQYFGNEIKKELIGDVDNEELIGKLIHDDRNKLIDFNKLIDGELIDIDEEQDEKKSALEGDEILGDEILGEEEILQAEATSPYFGNEEELIDKLIHDGKNKLIDKNLDLFMDINMFILIVTSVILGITLGPYLLIVVFIKIEPRSIRELIYVEEYFDELIYYKDLIDDMDDELIADVKEEELPRAQNYYDMYAAINFNYIYVYELIRALGDGYLAFEEKLHLKNTPMHYLN